MIESKNISISLKVKKYFLRLVMWLKYRPAWENYVHLSQNANENQEKLLLSILRKNSKTAFGRKFDFSSINSFEDYKKALKINQYEFFRPWIDNIISGSKNELVSEDIDYFVTTSGTTGKAKYIPMTKGLENITKEMQKVMAYSIFKNCEEAFQGKLFTVVGSAVEERIGDFDCGSMSGKLYVSTSKLIQKTQTVPHQLYQIENYDLKNLLLATIALLSPTTTLFITANPSTLIRLNEIINSNKNQIREMLNKWDFSLYCKGNAECLRVNNINWQGFYKNRNNALNILEKKDIKIKDYWPHLKCITAWTKGSCSYLIPKIKKLVSSDTKIFELGYLSSEFRGTINIGGEQPRPMLTLGSNFYEFIPVEKYEAGDFDPVLAGDIEEGKEYYIIVTTQAGLYRYFINDIVLVTKKIKNCPYIEFVQKGKSITNITGEKLSESQILNFFSKYRIELDFFICLADPRKMEYTLYYEGKLPDFSRELNQYLSTVNIEYKAKVESKRLKKIKTVQLKDGTGDLFKAAQVAHGQRDSQLKHLHLDYLEKVKFIFEAYRA